jgi:hypothetical protein
MSQSAAILRHLERGRSLDPMSALERFGTMRLAARMLELKRAGHRIEAKIVRLGKHHWASYRLAQ